MKSFRKKKINSKEVTAHYLKDISQPKVTKEQSDQCEGEITKIEVKEALGNMVCNKKPANDDLTSQLYETFWSEPHCYYHKKEFFVWRIKHFSKTSSY